MGTGVKSPVQEQEGNQSWISPPSGGVETPGSQTEENAKTAKLVWSLYQSAKRWKESTRANSATIKENWGYWDDSKQWHYQRPNHLHMSVMNKVFPTVETFIGHAEDNIPESIARSRDVA